MELSVLCICKKVIKQICFKSLNKAFIDSAASLCSYLPFFLLQTLNQVSRVIRECWNQNPRARLTVLRLKKTLRKLWEEAEDEKFMTKSLLRNKILADKIIENIADV